MGLKIKHGNNHGIRINCKCGEKIELRWCKDSGHVEGIDVTANREVYISRIEKRQRVIDLLNDEKLDENNNGNKE